MQPTPQSRRRRTLAVLGRTLAFIAAAYLALAALAFVFQGRLIYYPSRQILSTPREAGMAYAEVGLTTQDGVKIHGWFVPAEQPTGTVLFFHGNGGNVSNRIELLRLFHDLNLNSLIIDYRGYGLSEGSPTEQGTYADAESAWRYLTVERSIPAAQIIVVGESLGGGVASWTAQQHAPRALVLQSTFTRLTDAGARQFPWLPVRWLSRYQYPTVDRLGQITCPILIIHSREDNLIPFALSQQNLAAAHAPKAFLEIHGGHNDGFLISREIYREGLGRFLAQY